MLSSHSTFYSRDCSGMVNVCLSDPCGGHDLSGGTSDAGIEGKCSEKCSIMSCSPVVNFSSLISSDPTQSASVVISLSVSLEVDSRFTLGVST